MEFAIGTVGRNNWIFFGSDEGGKTAAVLRSFVASCQRAGIDPFAWLKDILSRIRCPTDYSTCGVASAQLGARLGLITNSTQWIVFAIKLRPGDSPPFTHY